MIFGFGPPSTPTFQTGDVDPTLRTTVPDGCNLVEPSSITALALYDAYGYRISRTLTLCAWESGAMVSEGDLDNTIFLLSDLYRESGTFFLLSDLYRERGFAGDFSEVVYSILQATYPNENTEYLVTISKLLTETAVNKCTAYIPCQAAGYEELVDYLRSRGK